jgi:hypothetical protein
MTGAICWLSAARLACMVCATGSEAAASVVNGACDANGAMDAMGADDADAFGGVLSLAATRGEEDGDVSDDVEDVVDVAAGAESSAPQPVNAVHTIALAAAHAAARAPKVAHATSVALAGRLSRVIFASVLVKARAVSNPFKK